MNGHFYHFSCEFSQFPVLKKFLVNTAKCIAQDKENLTQYEMAIFFNLRHLKAKRR